MTANRINQGTLSKNDPAGVEEVSQLCESGGGWIVHRPPYAWKTPHWVAGEGYPGSLHILGERNLVRRRWDNGPVDDRSIVRAKYHRDF